MNKNLVYLPTYVKGKVKIERKKNSLTIKNNTNKQAVVLFLKPFKKKYDIKVKIQIKGKSIKGTSCKIEAINRRKTILSSAELNSTSYLTAQYIKYFAIVLYISPNSEQIIESITVEEVKEIKHDFSVYKGDILLVSPGYPSESNKYNSAFVHTRALEYKKRKLNVDVMCINENYEYEKYEFEGIKVVKADFFFLRNLLQNKHYKKILIHFFDHRYANVLESVNLTDTKLYFYLHGAETLYKDWPKICSRYFEEPAKITDELSNLFKMKDFYIKKYNEIENATWCFVTEWTKKRCEELLDIKFNNYEIVPCYIDDNLFKYEKKDIELRKKIFILRKFDDINSYSLDTCVRVILELSRRKIFKDIEFDIYGEGSLHDMILEPVKKFPNVHIHKTFLSHEQIREVHKSHGIALFPTRFDSQAVSSCEAASSGCAVITSNIPGTRQLFPNDMGILCEVENYKEYADVIEKMYNDPKYFLSVAEAESKSINEKFNYENTIQKDIDIIMKDSVNKNKKILLKGKPILSIIIPSYNVSQYIQSTIYSLIDQKNANKIEILVVNDGSKDDTLEKVNEIKKKLNLSDKTLKIINKENGGHGSTINVGIKNASGKYIKIVDGDDTVDSEEFARLIDILENEDSDVVLNNYIEDFAYSNTSNIVKIYNHLKEGIKYYFDDLCYEQYGFTSWGPILSCSSYKASMIKNKFELFEKTFYVDMQLNVYIAMLCNTVTYYDLNIYRYYLGRNGQSVSRDSYTRNYKHHERICLEMINIYEQNKEKLSQNKRRYIVDRLIIPMINTQYYICINYLKKSNGFRSFDKQLKKHKEFYNLDCIKIKQVVFHRFTKGSLIFMNGFFVRFNSFLSKFKR